jgi:outer membrane protein assembly factor BamB
MKWRLTILVIWLLCTGIVAEDTDDWPVFQHDPQHSGFSSTTMPTSLKKVWTTGEPSLFSRGFVNLAISEGRIFATRYDSISAFDMNTGSELWNREWHCSPSFPAVKNGRMYLSELQKVVCVDTDTGDIVWEHVVDLVTFYSSPIVIGNHVFVGGGLPIEHIVRTEESIEALRRARRYANRLLCLDARTGEICWEFYGGIDTTPAYLNGRIYVNDGSKTVYCLDAETGDTLWWKTIEWTNFSSVSLDGERIFVGTGEGVICLELETGQILWKSRCEGYILQTPAVAYNKVFVGSFDGVFYCMDAENGDIIWKIELEDKIPKVDRRISCSAAIADGKVAFGTGSGVLYIVDTESGKIYERSQLDDSFITALALSDGKLFVGQENGEIACFEESESAGFSSSVFIGIVIALFFVALLLVLWIRTRRR